MTARPDWAGWLPEDVQEAANTAARAGLLPVVCDAWGDAFDLWAPGDRYLACVGSGTPDGRGVILYHLPDDPDDDCVEVRGLFPVLAWIADRGVDAAPPTR